MSDWAKRDLLVLLNYPEKISVSRPWPEVAFAEALRDLPPSYPLTFILSIWAELELLYMLVPDAFLT